MPIVRITLPAEKRALREQMRALGLGHREIAAEFARRYRLRRNKPCPRCQPSPTVESQSPAQNLVPGSSERS